MLHIQSTSPPPCGVGSHLCSVLSLTTDSQPADTSRLSRSFIISAILVFDHSPLVLVTASFWFSHTVALLQLKQRKSAHQTEYVLCFLQCERYKIIMSTEEDFDFLFFFVFFLKQLT